MTESLTDPIADDRHRILDWRPKHDPRSLGYPARTVLKGSTRLRNKSWRLGPVLDQGFEGACVGFGWTADALATPVPVDVARVAANGGTDDPEAFARMAYGLAQRLDEWEGTDYEGTSVNAGAKAMRGLGLLHEYRWCFGIGEVADAVLAAGPVVIGIPWYSGMYDAPGGILDVDGYKVGGHCLIVAGYSLSGGMFKDEAGFLLRNSWGTSWGHNGSAFIRESALAALLADDGEAAIATRRSYGRAAR